MERELNDKKTHWGCSQGDGHREALQSMSQCIQPMEGKAAAPKSSEFELGPAEKNMS